MISKSERLITIQKLGPWCDRWARELDGYYAGSLRKRYDFSFKLDTTPLDDSRHVGVIVTYYAQGPLPAPTGWMAVWQEWRPKDSGYYVALLRKDLEGII